MSEVILQKFSRLLKNKIPFSVTVKLIIKEVTSFPGPYFLRLTFFSGNYRESK